MEVIASGVLLRQHHIAVAYVCFDKAASWSKAMRVSHGAPIASRRGGSRASPAVRLLSTNHDLRQIARGPAQLSKAGVRDQVFI